MSHEPPRSWRRLRLGDVCEKPQYGYTASANPAAPGPRFLRITDIVGEYIDWDAVPRCAMDNANLSKYLLHNGDIVVARTGASVGAAAVVATSALAVFASYLVRFRPRRDEAQPAFLGYFLRSPAWSTYVKAVSAGSAQPQMNAQVMAACELLLPNLDEQRRIAAVLAAFDAKIETHRDAEARLSQLLELLFRRYVVDADVNQMLPLSQLAEFVNGRNFTKGASGDGRPVIRIRELTAGIGNSTVFSDIQGVPDKHVAAFGDLLFAWSGTLGVHRWEGTEGLVNQHIFKVLPRDGFPLWFVDEWLRTHLCKFAAIARDKATTMGHIRREDLDQAMAAVPIPTVLRTLDERLGPLDALRTTMARERRHLGMLRDALLPKLLSGQVRVPDSYFPDIKAANILETEEPVAA